MARIMQLSAVLAVLGFLSTTIVLAQDLSSEDMQHKYYEALLRSSDPGERFKRSPYLPYPGLSWAYPTERYIPHPYYGTKRNIGNLNRRYAFGIGKRNPYDYGYYDDYDEEMDVQENMNKRTRGDQKRKGFDFGLGKREISIDQLEAVQKEDEEAHHRNKRSLVAGTDNDDNLMEQRFQRGGSKSYSFGLGKRRNYNFGLGKRGFNDDDDDDDDEDFRQMDGYPYGQDKRGKSYSFGLGKRGNPNKQYSFGLGKRNGEDDDDDDDDDIDGVKRAKPYGFGLGKRDRNNKGYNFGLGKRVKNYSFGLGKREDDTAENNEKRGNRNQQYSFGLGKRTSETSEGRLDAGSNKDALLSVHADTSDHHL